MSFMIPNDQIGEIDTSVIIKLLKKYNPKSVCEVGCWTGGVSSLIMKNTSSVLTVIDTFDGSGSHLKDFIKDSSFDVLKAFHDNLNIYLLRINILCGTTDFFKDDLKDFDFVFIDGDHRYSSVSKDINILWDKLLPGGVMAGHDYDMAYYNEKYIEQDYVDGCHHGVTKAVNEKFKEINREGRVWWVEKPLGSPTTNELNSNVGGHG